MLAGVKPLNESPGPPPPSMLVGPRELPEPKAEGPPPPKLEAPPPPEKLALLNLLEPLPPGPELLGAFEDAAKPDAPDKSTVFPGSHEGAL